MKQIITLYLKRDIQIKIIVHEISDRVSRGRNMATGPALSVGTEARVREIGRAEERCKYPFADS
jgi:hypothetical protein